MRVGQILGGSGIVLDGRFVFVGGVGRRLEVLDVGVVRHSVERVLVDHWGNSVNG